MFATNFEDISKEKISNLFDFIQNNKFSNFYSEKMSIFGSRNPTIYEDFSQFPFLTKNEILEKPITDRTFVDKNSIEFYAISSGTSKHPVPAIIPHTERSYIETELNGYDKIKKEGKIKTMLLLNGINSSLVGFLNNSENKNVIFTIGDPNNLRMSAIIAKEIWIEAIATTPSVLYAFMKELKSVSYDLDNIIWVSLGSEYCTKVMYSVFQSNFKKCYFNFRYGNTEFHGKIGVRCDHLNKNAPPGVFHLHKHEIIEIVDENWYPVQMGELWEIIISDNREKAFPLVRFRLWDYWILREEKCECGEHLILEMAWRAQHDFLKFHGITLRTEMVYESLKDYLTIFDGRFEMHVYEEQVGEEVKPYFTLHASLLQNRKSLVEDPKTLELIIQDVSQKLQLGKNSSYATMVEMGNFLPMRIEIIEKWENTRKNIGIVSHL